VESFDPKVLQERLKALVEQQEIYRIKGFVSVPEKPMRMVLQGVGERFEQFYDRPWQPEEPRETRLVFIGRSLDSAQIESQLSSLGNPA
jgi:cobalamin biosynthesis protein CobW